MAHPKSRLDNLKASARKSLSQNFLSSPHWAEKLVNAVIDEHSHAYWEIGPGLGALTQLLVKQVQHPITVFEYDRKLSEDLRQTFPGICVIEGDFLKAELEPLFPKGKVSVLSNTPYHLSSPILFRLLEHRTHFTRIVLTFQKEFADRLVASPRTKAYGGLSVMCQLSFSITSLGVIPPGAFYPPPTISSQALVLKPLPEGEVPFANLQKVVKAAFIHRRKKLLSNLKDVFDSADVDAAASALKIAPMARPEELTKETYQDLTKYLT